MENQKHRDQAKNQKQQLQKAGSGVVVSGQTVKVHLDPIQSIANVLNHHHSEQQKSKHNKQAQQVSIEGKNFVSVSAARAQLEPDLNEENRAELLSGQKRGQKIVKQQVDRVTGRPLLLTVDNNNKNNGGKSGAEQLSKQQQVDDTDRVAQAASGSTSADLVAGSGDRATAANSSLASATIATNRSQDYKCAQVDQGNSYLYAYNDFITPSAHLSSSASSSSSSASASNQIGVSETKGNKQQAREHDLRIARQQTKQQIRSSGKQANKSLLLPQVCLLTGETLLSTTKDDDSNKPSSKPAKNKLSSSLRRTNKVRAATAAANQQQRQVVEAAVGEQRRHEQEEEHDEDESEEENRGEKSGSEDDDDEEEETLSYILNRHNLLVAQQRQAALAANQRLQINHSHHHSQHLNCNLLHLNQQLDGSLNQVPTHLVCSGHQLAAVVENPNHLRQYLQIEENFNSYKAARRKSRRGGGVASQAIVDSTSVYQQRPSLVGADDDLAPPDQHQQQQQQHRLRASTNKQSASSSFLPYQLEPNLMTTNEQQQQSSSSLSSSLSSLANLTGGHSNNPNQVSLLQERASHLAQHHHHHHHQGNQQPSGLVAAPRGYLQFFARLAPLSFGSSGQSGAHKMYSASQQVGQLAGQAGAYYVTTKNAPGDRQQENNNISQQHLNHAASHHYPNQLNHHHHQQQLMGAHAHAHHLHHHPHSHLHNHHQQQHSYPVTTASNSSLGSSGAFATSAVRRTTSWLRDFCSKRCLFVTCLMLILFIFILVISLSAYLNFLISANKVNLQPLSGRLRVMLDSMTTEEDDGGGGGTTTTSSNNQTTAQALRALMMHNSSQTSATSGKTSQEFLQKQRDFETILRGALDRTQPTLKTYPNHLVKLEVYSFKPSQQQQQPPTASNDLWVYFRLFVNKRSLQQDGQLMKRKSPDEQFDKQFLPRLTQQTLLNGFEQLITTFGSQPAPLTTTTTGGGLQTGASGARLALSGGKPVADQSAALDKLAGQQLGINSRRFGQPTGESQGAAWPPNRRTSRAIAAALAAHHQFASSSSSSSSANKSLLSSSQQQQLKSFDEKISRLMHLIEAIDLQSIFVTPDFDMTQTMQQLAPSTSQIMSETLKASRPIIQTTTTATATTTTGAGQQPRDSTTTTNNNNNNGNNVMVASGSNGVDQYETIQDNNNNNKLSQLTSSKSAEKQLTTRQPVATDDELELDDNDDNENGERANNGTAPSPKPASKFTLAQSYRENSTRPSLAESTRSTSTTPPSTLLMSSRPPTGNPKDSLFLVNHQQKPQTNSGTTKPGVGKQAVVRLVSGQPVVSQSGQTLADKQAAQKAADRAKPQPANGLFVALPKVDQQQQPNSTQAPRGNLAAPVSVNSSLTTGRTNVPTSSASSTLAPTISIPELWQNTFSGKQNVSTLEISNNNVESIDVPAGPARPRLITVTTIGNNSSASQRQATMPADNRPHLSSSEWQKISVLEVSDRQGGGSGTMRAQLNASPGNNNNNNQSSLSGSTVTPLMTTTTSQTVPSSTSSRPPKVAPHLNLGGSIVSTSVMNNGQGQKPQRQQQQQHSSAVVLNRDLTNGGNNSTSLRANTNNQQPKLKHQHQSQKLLKQRPSNSTGASIDGHTGRPTQMTRTNTTTRLSTQSQKPTKIKKVVAGGESAKNQTAIDQESASSKPPLPLSTGTTNGKGIRIVDNFLASIGSTDQSQPAANRTTTSAVASANSNAPTIRQKEPAQTFLPTLPTTIELTRSTTSTPPRSTTPLTAPKPRPASTNFDSASELRNADLENAFVLASQQARPGTTSFSGQWRPLGNNGGQDNGVDSSATIDGRDFWSAANRTGSSSTQRPRTSSSRPAMANLSLIVATERLPATLNQASGSQSPFSMPSLMMTQPQQQQQQQQPQFSNRFRAQTASPRTTPPTNDFESHRVSRMRQSQAYSHRASDHVDPFGVSSSVSTVGSSSGSMSSSSTTTTTTSSLNLVDSSSSTPPNTRIVDDFMITTTDRNDDQNGRATTLLPPLVLSGLQGSASMAAPRSRFQPDSGTPTISLVVPQGLKRTRGPFAFETLRSFAAPVSPVETSSESIASPSEPVAPDSFEVSEPTATTSIRAERSSAERAEDILRRQQQQQQQQSRSSEDQSLPVVTQEKLLLRKRLFIEGEPGTRLTSIGSGSASEDELNFLPSTSSPFAQLDGNEFEQNQQPSDGAKFGNRFNRMSTTGNEFRSSASSQPFGNGAQLQTNNRCSYYGCRGRVSGEFVCLNSSQICDDFIDCQDETDELDCVSLLKLEPKTNKMSFSNGAGIIYLNRRGSLAPMCLDYFGPTTTTTGDKQQANNDRRLDELVKQINAIGQYACSLQSFSRLVSVKINHHDLVDGLNEIRSSKLFHRLTVVETGNNQSSNRQQQQQVGAQVTSPDSFKASNHYQVSIGASSECPSQRTVFVKCGGFQCGQDSFNVPPALQAETRRNGDESTSETRSLLESRHTRDNFAMNDFPWLVKLYHFNSLACHGYLIDESWLVAASECFANNTNDDPTTSAWSLGSWTAEISYEHYGNDDYKSIESNRRAVKDVLVPPFLASSSAGTLAVGGSHHNSHSPPIVLAKLERPVRFSPLNRPICLPSTITPTNNKTTTIKATAALTSKNTEFNRANYRDCLTAYLPIVGSTTKPNLNSDSSTANNLNGLPPTQSIHNHQHDHKQPDMILNKVELSRAEDCFHQDLNEVRREQVKNLICANGIRKSEIVNGDDDGFSSPSSSSSSHQNDAATRVLICSQSITTNSENLEISSKLRSKWVVVGFQFKQGHDGDQLPAMRADAQLFVSVSSQIDWIVDTMNPKSVVPGNDDDSKANPHRLVAGNNSYNNPYPADYTNTPFHLRLSPNSGGGGGEHTNELNPLFNNNNQQQTCTRFRCSSGECLSWSRICDGLYDCSSHDDEKDCHK